MRVITRRSFRHAGDLASRYASADPRTPGFATAVGHRLDVDMRGTDFIRPAAVVWCAVYTRLAVLRGVGSQLLVPRNVGVCTYLKAVGLFDELRRGGAEVDDRGIRDSVDPKIILPLTRFATHADVDRLSNRALDRLLESGLGAANLRPVVTEIFAELAMNAVEHSESEIGGYGLIQFFEFEQGERFVCVVGDGGIGIRGSLERNPLLRDEVPYDWIAIERALREGVSGTGKSTRGMGLYGVAEDLQQPGRQLVVHSGQGALTTSEDVESQARRVTLFSGTLVMATLRS